jgi:hypothetical protein
VVEQDVTAKKVEIDPATGKERVLDESTSVVKAAPEVGPEPAPKSTDEKKHGGKK